MLQVIIIVVVWIFSFMLLVVAHEFGHFIAAKKSWVKVLEFGLGIPPKLFRFYKDRDGTEYTINAIPLWWFVRLKGEDPEKKEEFNARDSLIQAKIWKKVIILLGWVTMNFLLAWLIFTFIFKIWVTPISILPENSVKTTQHSYLMPTITFLQEQDLLSWELTDNKVLVWEVIEWIWQDIWLTWWDIVLSVNDNTVNYYNISKTLQDQIWKEIVVRYDRDGTIIEKSALCPDDSCMLWIALISSWNIWIKEIRMTLDKAMIAWLQEIRAQSAMTFSTLWTLGKNLISFDKNKIKTSISKLTWPAWAIKVWEKLLEAGWWKVLLWFAGMISLALAIFNVLPIPALDGWRLLGSLIQRGFKIKPDKYFAIESYINMVFFVLLMWLWIVILLKDLVRFRNVPIPFIS